MKDSATGAGLSRGAPEMAAPAPALLPLRVDTTDGGLNQDEDDDVLSSPESPDSCELYNA